MNKRTLALVSVFCILGVASAQEATPTPVSPSQYQNGSTCEAHATRHLLAATDSLKRADQDWNLKAAEAYERLAKLGFQEC